MYNMWYDANIMPSR